MQTSAVPVQTPCWQPSPVVQASPSLHGVLGALLLSTHAPLEGSHVETLQKALAVQVVVLVGVHVPPWQLSPWVQALWSSQSAPSLAFVSLQAPLAGLQALTLHGPLGVHETASPLQMPPRQLSSRVHALPSSQRLPSGRR